MTSVFTITPYSCRSGRISKSVAKLSFVNTWHHLYENTKRMVLVIFFGRSEGKNGGFETVSVDNTGRSRHEYCLFFIKSLISCFACESFLYHAAHPLHFPPKIMKRQFRSIADAARARGTDSSESSNESSMLLAASDRRRHLQELRSRYQRGELVRVSDVLQGDHAPITYAEFAVRYMYLIKVAATSANRKRKASCMGTHEGALDFNIANQYSDHQGALQVAPSSAPASTAVPSMAVPSASASASTAVAPASASTAVAPTSARSKPVQCIIVTPPSKLVAWEAAWDCWERLLPLTFHHPMEFLRLGEKTALERCTHDPQIYLIVMSGDVTRRCYSRVHNRIIVMQTEQLMGEQHSRYSMRILDACSRLATFVLDWNPGHVCMMKARRISTPMLFPTTWGLPLASMALPRRIKVPSASTTIKYDVVILSPRHTYTSRTSKHQKAVASALGANGLRVYVGSASPSKRRGLLASAMVLCIPHYDPGDTGIPLYELSSYAALNPNLLVVAERCSGVSTPTSTFARAAIFTDDIVSTTRRICAKTPQAEAFRKTQRNKSIAMWDQIHKQSPKGFLQFFHHAMSIPN